MLYNKNIFSWMRQHTQHEEMESFTELFNSL